MRNILKWLDKKRLVIPTALLVFGLGTYGTFRLAQRDLSFPVNYVLTSFKERCAGPTISLSELEKIATHPASIEEVKRAISLDKAKDYSEVGGDLFLANGVLTPYLISNSHEPEAKLEVGRQRYIEDNYYFYRPLSYKQILYFHNPQEGKCLGPFHIHLNGGSVRWDDVDVIHNFGTNFVITEEKTGFKIYELFDRDILGNIAVKY